MHLRYIERRLVNACTSRNLVPALMHAHASHLLCSRHNLQHWYVLECPLNNMAADVLREDGNGLQPLNDVCCYSTVDNAWQTVTVAGQGPSARNAAIACVVADRKMLLHGGWDPFKQTYSDSFLLQSEAIE